MGIEPETQLERDVYWLARAYLYGQAHSVDRSRKIGCLIVRGGKVVARGWNRFPPGVQDREERHERPAKYLWTEHAERVALSEALLASQSVYGTTMYIPWFPCADCARGIIEAGISTVVVSGLPDLSDPTYGQSFSVATIMLAEASVTVRVVPGAVPVQERKPDPFKQSVCEHGQPYPGGCIYCSAGGVF